MPFNVFSLNPHLEQAVRLCGYAAPTPIQQQAIPPILERRDILGLAQTGTGKTAAFALPMVQHLMQTPGKGVRVLILAPTRELAEQINAFVDTITAKTRLRSIAVYGGVSKQAQITRIRAGVDIVVACPGRLLDLLSEKAVNLGQVETLILDEADHMFDKGFLPDIRRILRQLPKERQTLVFSATMPAEIRHLAEDILRDPVTVQINPTRSVDTITHLLYAVEQGQKTELLMHLLKDEAMATTLIFTKTKYKAKNLALRLSQSGFKATSLQGNLSQNKRQQALDGFKNGAFNVLVATDIAARGIDVTGISHVVNYDMPDTTEAYIHRTGRTGRAARSGEALTFATVEDGRMVKAIERVLDGTMSRQSTDTFPVLRQAHKVSVQVTKRPGTEHSSPKGKTAPQGTTGNRSRSKRPAASGIFGLARRSR
jgi:ATP-dependent RNA helicase RhlE